MAWKRLHLRNRVRFFRSPSSELYPQGLFTLRVHPCLWLSRERTSRIPIGACRTHKKPAERIARMIYRLQIFLVDAPVTFTSLILGRECEKNSNNYILFFIIVFLFFIIASNFFFANTKLFIKYIKYVKNFFLLQSIEEKKC